MYETTKTTTGWAAALGAGGYMMAAALAASDGPDRGVEIPREVSMISVATISVLVVISIVMRIVDRSNQVSVERDVRYIVATELEVQLAKLVAGVESKIQANNRKIQSTVQAAVKAEVAAGVEEVNSCTFRVGLVRDAQDAANGGTVHRISSHREG